MKAIVIREHGGPDVLCWEDMPDPSPDADQVLIRVAAASVNYADIKARMGGYHGGRQPPFSPGLDVAGVVVATGTAVTAFQQGDRVIAFPANGSYAELTVADQRLTFALPESLPIAEAAALPVVAGAAHRNLVAVGGIKRGDRVLIHSAAGGVGTVALQIASHMGASMVIGSTTSSWKVERIQSLGADLVIDNTAADYSEQVLAATGGKGADIILNPLGGERLTRDLGCLAPFGRLVVYGGKKDPVPVSSKQFYPKNQSIMGSSFGHLRRTRPDAAAKTMHAVLDLLDSGAIRAVIDKRFPMAQAADAHRYIENRENIGKVLLDADSSLS